MVPGHSGDREHHSRRDDHNLPLTLLGASRKDGQNRSVALVSSIVTQAPIIWVFYQEEVLICVECDNELVQKSLSAENPLEWHLESPVLNKATRASHEFPGYWGRFNSTYSNWTIRVCPRSAMLPGIGAERANIKTERLCRTAVKDG
jgi:hypothetical protein